MHTTIMILVALVREMVGSRAALHLGNMALRQHVAVLKRERARPRLHPHDRVSWVFLSRPWPRWKDARVIVKPETVIAWHRQGFRLVWKWKSCHGKLGRPWASKEVRELIQRMSRFGDESATEIAMNPSAVPALPRALPMAARQIQTPFLENTLLPPQ